MSTRDHPLLFVSPSTASALAPHAADDAWVMFVQVNPPFGTGPIKIEGVDGERLATRLRAIAADNAFTAMLIGLVHSTKPAEDEHALAAQFVSAHLHDGWFSPTTELLTLIQSSAQTAIQDLLARTHPGALEGEATVDIERMAKILGCSVSTIRRMVHAEEVPYLRWGRMLRFVPDDVIASLHRRQR